LVASYKCGRLLNCATMSGAIEMKLYSTMLGASAKKPLAEGGGSTQQRERCCTIVQLEKIREITRLRVAYLDALLLVDLVDERLVNVGDHTTTSNGCLDEGVQLFVTTDGQLQVTRRDALHLQVFGGVTSQL